MSIFKLKVIDSRDRFHSKWIKDRVDTFYFLGYNGNGTYTANIQYENGEWKIISSIVYFKEILYHIKKGNWCIVDAPDNV